MNTDYKSAHFLKQMVPELFEWFRRFYPLLYTQHNRNSTRIMLIPADVKDYTEGELTRQTHVEGEKDKKAVVAACM